MALLPVTATCEQSLSVLGRGIKGEEERRERLNRMGQEAREEEVKKKSKCLDQNGFRSQTRKAINAQKGKQTPMQTQKGPYIYIYMSPKIF